MAGDSDDTPTASPYDRIGGQPTLREAVDRFYARVLDDPELAPYFEGKDMARIKRHQVLLLGQVLGGPQDYDGRELGEAHAGLGVTGADYDRVVQHLVAVLVEMGVPDDILAAVGEVLTGVRPDIVARTGDPSDS
jgi:hemoglobin